MDRLALRADFLIAQGWGGAERRFLAGDASARSYERVALPGRHAVLMDAPSGCGDDVADFVKIANHLRELGLSAPAIYGQDLELGFLLIEDLGNALYTDLAQDRAVEPMIYAAAVEVLAHLQKAPAPAGLPDLSQAQWAQSTSLAVEDYAGTILGETPDPKAFYMALDAALAAVANDDKVLILRDFHAGNLLWLSERSGLERVGLLDFQLGQMGQPAYDLVSMLQDARRDVAPETEAQCLALFAKYTGQDLVDLRRSYAVLGALRALRILGIFARLCVKSAKPQYLQYLPRVWGQLLQNLSHPDLTDLQQVCLAILPPPTPENIQKIANLCPQHPIP